MKQRKTMRIWQMILILFLSVAMVITMFLPAFSFSGKKVEKMFRTVFQTVDLDDFGFSQEEVDEEIEGIITDYDEKIQKYEKENNVKISSISPWNIMTKSFVKISYGDNITEEELQEYQENEAFLSAQKGYNLLRIFLWIVYMLVLVVLLMTILGFCLKWTKFIPLIISSVYGLSAAVIFGYFRFGLMSTIEKKIISAFSENDILGKLSELGVSISISKILSCFYSIAFLFAFIVAILIIIVSVLSMILGNRVASVPNIEISEFEGEVNALDGDDRFGKQAEDGNPFDFRTDAATEQATSVINVTSVQTIPEGQTLQVASVQVVPQPMGQVKCTKGIAVGQGFMLPQDRKVIVGKSPQNANLVINNVNVSNVHCSIRYNAVTNTYIVKDHSSNGTFVNGVRLQKDIPMEYPAGTVLSLADGSNQITLG